MTDSETEGSSNVVRYSQLRFFPLISLISFFPSAFTLPKPYILCQVYPRLFWQCIFHHIIIQYARKKTLKGPHQKYFQTFVTTLFLIIIFVWWVWPMKKSNFLVKGFLKLLLSPLLIAKSRFCTYANECHFKSWFKRCFLLCCKDDPQCL